MSTAIRRESLFIHSIKNAGNWFIYHAKTIMVIAMAFIVMSMGVTAFAAPEGDEDEDDGGAVILYGVVCKMIETIVNADGGEDIQDKVNVTYSGGTLTIGGMDVYIGNILETFNDVAIIIAECLLVITFCVSLSNIRDFGFAAYELTKKLIILVVGFFLITKSMDICFAISNTSMSVSGRVIGAGEEWGASDELGHAVETIEKYIYEEVNTETKKSLTDAFGIVYLLQKLGLWIKGICICITYMFLLVLPYLLSLIARLILAVVVWGRAVEIVLLAAFSPLAFSDMVGEQWGSGPGARFLKSYGALCLSGVMILAVMSICGIITAKASAAVFVTADPDSFIQGIYVMLGITFAECGLVLRAQQISKTLFGVG